MRFSDNMTTIVTSTTHHVAVGPVAIDVFSRRGQAAPVTALVKRDHCVLRSSQEQRIRAGPCCGRGGGGWGRAGSQDEVP